MLKYTVYYLGHSAWMVETDERCMIFDYGEGRGGTGGPEAGVVNLNDFSSKQIFLFFSHSHHDHYDKKLHKTAEETGKAVTVLGGFGASAGNTFSLIPRTEREIAGVIVSAAASTDAGACFLVKAGGLAIYHGGDNADWGDGDLKNKRYSGEIDYLADQAGKAHIAFIPVCTFTGKQPEDMLEGALYSLNKLAPENAFPMHANGREFLYEKFAAYTRNKGYCGKIICMKSPGESKVFTTSDAG